MTYTKTIQPDASIEIKITYPWTEIQTAYKQSFTEIAKTVEIDGFRKGKAPEKILEKAIDKNKVYEDLIQHLVPKTYGEIIDKEGIKPFVRPSITLTEAKEESDWLVTIVTCEKPVVTVGDYKEAIKKIKKDTKNPLWIPGDKKEKEENKEEKKETPNSLNDIVGAVLSVTKGSIPSILVEEDVQRQLSDLVDRTRELGLTIDQYLASTKKTKETLREEYAAQATNSLLVELALEYISDKEKITVSDDEIKKIIESSKSEEEKQNMQKNTYYLTSILRRQKTLDSLLHA